MAVTMQERAYAWATQTDYQTQKVLAANALKETLNTDNGFINHQPAVVNDEGWSHGYNTATEQWLESHNNDVSHSMPGFVEEMPKIFKGTLGGYAVATPAGGTTSKNHTITPQDPNVSRQLQAVTYAEKVGAGHNILCPSMLFQSFSLKGNDLGMLMLDYSLRGSGKIVNPSGVNWTNHVQKLTALNKLFNTQIALTITDGVTPVVYGCKYRSFELAVQNEFLEQAGYKPGCNQYQTTGDNTSGAVKSELLFSKQNMTFNFTADLETDSGEFEALIKQKPMAITLTAEGTIIEGAIRRKLEVKTYKTYYTARQIAEANGVATLQVSGNIFTEKSNGKSLEIIVTNNIATYATW